MTVLSTSVQALTTVLLLGTDVAERTPGRATAPDLDPERTSQSLLLLLGAVGIVVLVALVIVVAVLRRPHD